MSSSPSSSSTSNDVITETSPTSNDVTETSPTSNDVIVETSPNTMPPLPDVFQPTAPGPEPCAYQRAVMQALGLHTIAAPRPEVVNKINWVTPGGSLISLGAEEIPLPSDVLKAVEVNAINIGRRLQRREILTLLQS